jgi:two-component system LytT family response regulator
VAFVTAYDEYAVRAFELNAIDYLLKPVERTRLRETLNRVAERLERGYSRNDEARNLEGALQEYAVGSQPPYLERIPVRHREEILIIPVINIASIIADGELLQITTIENRRYTINYRLKDLAARLNPTHFLRLGRGAVVNIELITRITPMPGGTFLVTLNNNQQLKVSRLQSRSLRERLLKL